MDLDRYNRVMDDLNRMISEIDQQLTLTDLQINAIEKVNASYNQLEDTVFQIEHGISRDEADSIMAEDGQDHLN